MNSNMNIAWQAASKKDESKITDIHMLLMVEKGIRGKLCLAIHRHAKDNGKYMKEYGKNIKSPYFQYYDVNNLYGWTISQKLPVNNFRWVKYTLKFDENFVKSYNEKSEIS